MVIAALLHQHVVIAPLSVSKEHQSYNSLELLATAIFLYVMFTLILVCELLTIISSRSITPFWSKQPKFLSSLSVHHNFWVLEFTIYFSCNKKFENIILCAKVRMMLGGKVENSTWSCVAHEHSRMIKKWQGQNICKFNGFKVSDPLPFPDNSVGYLSRCLGWYDIPAVSSSLLRLLY